MIIAEIQKFYLNRGNLLASCNFFALALFCFTLTLGSEGVTLNICAPAVFWILAILTFLFSTPYFLKMEFQAGLLDEIFLHSLSSFFYFLARIGAEVLLLGLPLIMIGGFFSSFFSLSLVQAFYLMLTLLIGFPALSALGILGGLLTLQTQGGGMLVSLLILPLTLPLLLFSLSVMELVRLGLDSFAPFCLLTSVSISLVILSVGAARWALSIAVEE